MSVPDNNTDLGLFQQIISSSSKSVKILYGTTICIIPRTVEMLLVIPQDELCFPQTPLLQRLLMQVQPSVMP
jgi:uncharacterized membrane protein